MVLTQGDVIMVNLDPTLGHEPQKRRPAVVVSSSSFNMVSSLTVVAPITSSHNSYPLHVTITSAIDVRGSICVEQLRSIDLNKRTHEHVGCMNQEDLSEILEKVGAVFGI